MGVHGYLSCSSGSFAFHYNGFSPGCPASGWRSQDRGDVVYFFQEVLRVSVILYSKPHCLECNVLKRFLKDYRISYEVRDCTAHPEYLDEVKKMGFLGVPVTVVNGTPVQGLQPDRILELLGREGEA
jgi:glutaredoxin-like protein NrdH